MCGINGIVHCDAERYESEIALMNETLVHRGPDERGVHVFNGCILGHDRLSIVDLSTGKQPMVSEDGKLGVVFNGEIYGYKKIRKGLDYRFRTTSDTEVILALYRAHGTNLAGHLPGMFAFALWDAEKRQLFCARDRFGEKPFYYAIGKGGEFVFSSEIKAIISSGLVEPVLDTAALSFYLKHLYVHPRKTIYLNVHTLAPAHHLIFRDGRIAVGRYWCQPQTTEDIGVDDAIERCTYLFDRAVENQLIADVPVGAFLSGGLDSSTVVAVASRYTKRMQTFSFGFEDSLSELPYAREIAEKYTTDHVELCDKEDIGDLLLKMDEVFDEPFADSSNIPTYLISKFAGKHVKVVLTGDGGDELLGGYGSYKPFLYAKDFGTYRPIRAEVLKLCAKVALKCPVGTVRLLGDSLKGLSFSAGSDSAVEAHLAQNNVFSDDDLAFLGLESGIDGACPGEFAWSFTDSVDDAMRTDLDVYMPGDILTKIDRASMANSIELRAPFLDVDLASFCISLPHSLKISKDDDKILLRKAFADTWTDSVRKRKKHGFGAPVRAWLQRKSVVEIKEHFLYDRSRKIFDLVSYKRSRKFVGKNNYQTWALLVLSIWMENRHFRYYQP